MYQHMRKYVLLAVVAMLPLVAYADDIACAPLQQKLDIAQYRLARVSTQRDKVDAGFGAKLQTILNTVGRITQLLADLAKEQADKSRLCGQGEQKACRYLATLARTASQLSSALSQYRRQQGNVQQQRTQSSRNFARQIADINANITRLDESLAACRGCTTSASTSVYPVCPAPDPDRHTCPTDIEYISYLKLNPYIYPYTNYIPSSGDIYLYTGMGLATGMHVLPQSHDWNGTMIGENVWQVSSAFSQYECPAAIFGNKPPCEAGGSGESTFTVGNRLLDSINHLQTSSVMNVFVDIHSLFATDSMLDRVSPPVWDCYFRCGQQYTCSGQAFGPVFYIDYHLTRQVRTSTDRPQGFPITVVTVSKHL
jgi:hypothetical protein